MLPSPSISARLSRRLLRDGLQPEDRLRLEVLAQAGAAPLAPVPGPLHAAEGGGDVGRRAVEVDHPGPQPAGDLRSEEQTSELQSLLRNSKAVSGLKKKHND